MIHFEIHPINPQQRLLEQTVRLLKNENGICVYPTDTVYGMGASITSPRAIERLVQLTRLDKMQLFSFICSSFSEMAQYVRISNPHFKLMKRYLPGPYTFILPATHLVPKKICPKRKTVGVRIPSNPVCMELVKMLGVPLANTSIQLPREILNDPYTIKPAVLSQVDVMLDAGILDDPGQSTIIDLTGNEPMCVREGKGIWEE
jgi:tRNA threonylcarbamoyl adenosine modification protein (Sua5/YciO/YrdC/YwlC family)